MFIKHAVEKEDGSFVFQGELTGQELNFVVEVGLNTLFAKGAIPFLVKDDNKLVSSAPEAVQ